MCKRPGPVKKLLHEQRISFLQIAVVIGPKVVMGRRLVIALRKSLATLTGPHAEFSISCRCCHTVSQRSNCTLTGGCRFSSSACCVEARDQHLEKDVSLFSLSSRKVMREELWREFFSDPSQWWDHRSEKVNPRYPDFKHKKTQQGLWIIDNFTPPWVKAELATERHVLPAPIRDRKTLREKLWRDFFSDLSQWRDHRSEKVNPRYPDFKHKTTGQALWLDSSFTPPWVEAELNTMVPGLLQSDSFSWNVRLRGLVEFQDYQKTLNLFQQMQREGMVPDKFTYVQVVKACSHLKSLEEGRRVHQQIIQRGCESEMYVANCLVDMYAKCGSIEDAWIVFSRMRERSVVSWTAMIVGYVKAEQGLKALELFSEMQGEGVEPDAVTFVGLLNACASIAASEEGRSIHQQIIRRGCESDVHVSNSLVDMYAKCGSIDDAWSVFNKMPWRDVVSWNAMIGGYVKSEQGLKALELFCKMQQEGVEPNTITFVGVLNACASAAALEQGRHVHEQIIRKGWESDVHVTTCLVDMYAKCGSIEDAWSVFKKTRERDVVSWNAMVVGYVKSEQALKALELFHKMQREGVEPNSVTFVGVLNACASLAAFDEGMRVHKQIIQRGFEFDVYVATCLIDMYAKCGCIKYAWSVFERMQERSVVSWNAMIGGYVKSEQGLKALDLFRKMQEEGVDPNTVTYVAVLNACASATAREEGRRIHDQIILRGCEPDIFVSTCLVDMYAKWGSIEDAWSVFDKMRERDVVSWNAMIVGYVKSEQGLKALELFRNMQQDKVEPNAVTFAGALNACASVAALEEGRCVHEQIIRRRCEFDVHVATGLVDMYAKCGSIKDAWNVFNKMQERDVISWNAMIMGYVKCEQGLQALELFRKMQQEWVEADAASFVGALNACASLVVLEEGRRVHKQIIRRGCESDVCVANCLIDMYAKCGSIEDACSVFNKMLERDVVSWNAMIAGYVKCEQALKALELFCKMQQEGVEPNSVTFVGVLNACATVVAPREGRRVHRQIIRRGYEYNVYVANCLVDMYAKCGSIKDARHVFNKMPERNVVSWNAMIGGYAMHGDFQKAVELFERMGKEGVEVNQITFICLLSACSHRGLVEEGQRYFKTLTSDYNVLVTGEHYGCMVDLLGRAGRLEEAEEKAEEMMKRMPLERDSFVWMTLLGACRIHGNVEMAERAAKRCWELDPKNASAYVLLSNIYAAAGKWDRGAVIEQGRLERKLRKVPGRTWIEVKNVVHSFVVDDKEHPQLPQIHAELDRFVNEAG